VGAQRWPILNVILFGVDGADVPAVVERIRHTNAARAQFLGGAFAFTFLLAGLGDLAGMGTLANHGFMAAQLFLSLAVVVLVRWTSFGRRHASFIFAALMSAVSATGAAHLAQFGGLDGPYFYGSYTAPPVMIPMLFSLRRRLLWTTTTVLSFVVVYAVARPGLFDHPMAHIPVVYLLTIGGISVSLGHYVYRLEVGSFVDVARLEAAALHLEVQLKSGESSPSKLREAIARQLHDDVAQLITGARIHLDGWAQPRGDLRGRADSARRVAELLDELALRARRMLEELRAPPVRGHLFFELERLQREYAPMGLAVDIVADATDVGGVGDVHADVIVSCVREGLTNAVRHGGATEATIGVRRDGRHLEVQVLDNGAGRIDGLREGYGLLGMRERVNSVGGNVALSEYDEGLKLTLSFADINDEVAVVVAAKEGA
jgi:signal transduction histidine kinase